MHVCMRFIMYKKMKSLGILITLFLVPYSALAIHISPLWYVVYNHSDKNNIDVTASSKNVTGI